MGQYFAAANTDKHEFLCPWCIGGGAKLWEWCANPTGAVLPLLLRKSDHGGGGDFYGYGTRTVDAAASTPKDMASAMMATLALEGAPVNAPEDAIAGRWAGDRVIMVGDYDSSKLWEDLYEKKTYTNISRRLVDAWNAFMDIDRMQLSYERCHSCSRE